MIQKNLLKKLTPVQKSLYLYIESIDDFPLSIKMLSSELNLTRQSVSLAIKDLVFYDLIDVIDCGTHKEIFKKDYLFGDFEK